MYSMQIIAFFLFSFSICLLVFPDTFHVYCIYCFKAFFLCRFSQGLPEIWILVLADWYYRLNLWSVSEKLFTYLTCIAFISFGFFMFILHLKLDLGVFFYQMCNQNCLQQTEQHKGKNHNAVCCWKDETSNSYFFFFWYLVLLHTWNTSPHLNIIP